MSSEQDSADSNSPRIPETQTSPKVYDVEKSFISKVVLASIGAFFLAILFNFPLEKNIIAIIEKQISKVRSCPLQYNGIELGYFLPKVIFKDVTIPGRCFQNPKASINVDQLVARVSVPSFWPIGVKAKVTALGDDLRLNIFPRLAIGGNAVQVEDTRIKGNFISHFLPIPLNINGNIDIQGNFEFKGKNIDTANFLLKSADLSLPAQSVKSFPLPTLNFRKLEIAGTQTKKKVHLKALRLGDANAPITAEFRGNIALNQSNMNFSQLNLQGKVKFSPEFLNNLSLLKLLLNGKKQKDGYYFLQISGTLARPAHRFVDPF